MLYTIFDALFKITAML